MIKVNVDFEAPDAGKTASHLFDDDVLLYFGQQAAKKMDKYVPYLDGPLSSDYVVTPEYVEYQQPYAHKQFNGDGFDFTRDYHPLATAHWDRAMMAADKEQLAKDVEDYIKARK